MKKAFTLSEVLITVAIIGVVAAISLPSLMSNIKQNEFKSGLKKAVNVLNNAINMNTTIYGDTPFDMKKITADLNGDGVIDGNDIAYLINSMHGSEDIIENDLALFLMRRMNVTKVGIAYDRSAGTAGIGNFAFYTTDGMRFEVPYPFESNVHLRLYNTDDEGNEIYLGANQECSLTNFGECYGVELESIQQRCGSYGLDVNPNNTVTPPCVVVVDVNGEKKPNPVGYARIQTDGKNTNSFSHSGYQTVKPGDNQLNDIFTIMITDTAAIPYGIVAQRSLYNKDKK